MEDCTRENNNNHPRKRARDDDDSCELKPNSPESKRFNVSIDSDHEPSEFERVDSEEKPESDSPVSEVCQLDSEDYSVESNGAEEGDELASPEVVRFREDILDSLDEPEVVPETQDLDSVIRSFEEEILQLSPSLSHQPEVELTSFPGEPQPDLGYLLEASDDELGLPPTVTAAGDQTQNEPRNITVGNEEDVHGLGNMVRFEDELPSYDSFEFCLGDRVMEGENYAENGNEGDFVTVDGLFDYADGSDFSELGWRPESLSAL